MAKGHTRWRGQSVQVMVYVGGGRYDTSTVQWQGSKKATQQAADRLLRQMLDDVDDGRAAGPDTTVAQLARRWTRHAEPEWTPRTVETYGMCVRLYILPTLGERKVRDIKAGDLDDLYSTLRGQGLSPATIRKVHVILRGMFGSAVRWRIIGHNPLLEAKPPRVPRAEIEPPAAAELLSLLELAAVTDEPLHSFLIVAADTGARRGEVCGLRWSKVDLDAGELVIDRAIIDTKAGTVEKDTKTHQARRVALGAPAIAALRAQRARAEEKAASVGVTIARDAYVFSQREDATTPWRPHGVTARFRRLRTKAGMPTVRLHDLRHAMATEWLAEGVDPRTVMGRLGHASLQTLTRYSHFQAAKDRDAAGRMGQRLSAPPAG